MDEGAFRKFAHLMVQVAEIYGEKLSEIKIQLYFELLKEYPYEIIEGAFVSHTKLSKFFPKPADIIELIEGSPEDKSLQAWLFLVDLIERYGYYYTIIVNDPVFVATVEDLGGWMHICSTWKKSELVFREKEFREKFKFNLKHPRKIENKLTGYIESYAIYHGYDLPDNYKILIGKPFPKPLKGKKRKQEVQVL